jgi:sec-independent protein translocase protein TatA
MFSGLESPLHLVVLVVIALLVFGPKRLPEIGRAVGGSLRGFKGALEGEEEPAAPPAPAAPTTPEAPEDSKEQLPD